MQRAAAQASALVAQTALDALSLDDAGGDAGDSAGQSFGQAMQRAAAQASADLPQILQQAGQAAADAGDAADGGSGGFRSLSSKMSEADKAANKAVDAFVSLVQKGYALGPAISVAVGAISSLVSGLVALGAQIGSAIPALIVLPSVFLAIGQAALTAKLAFGGIGAAVKQLGKKKTGGGGGGADKSKQIQAAEKSLARTLEANREALTRADKTLANAEDRLTEARIRAVESLQQLNFDAEDAAISEKKASIQLEKARETLARVQDLPPNSRARREAELAYAEADLNLRRAKDRNSDLTKETAAANKAGVSGAKEVVSATQAVQDAVDSKAKTERDALRSQVDAEQALADARKGGGGGGGGGEDDAMSKLTAEGQVFAQFIAGLKDKMNVLKVAAQKEIFPLMTMAIQNLTDNLFPALVPILEKTGGALGRVAVRISSVVTESSNLKELGTIGGTNAFMIEKLGDVFANLYDVMLSLFSAADPLIRRFGEWISTLTDGWKTSLEAKNKTGELTEMFNKAGDAAAQIGRILKKLFGAIMNIGKAASGPGSGGQMLMDTFENSMKKFEEFTKKLLDNGDLEKFFNDVAVNFSKISTALVKFAKEFLKLGDDAGVGESADGIGAWADKIGSIMETLIAGAPALMEAIGKLIDIVKAFTDDKSIKAYFGTLGLVFGILGKIFNDETAQKILLFVAPMAGVLKAGMKLNKMFDNGALIIKGYGNKLKGAKRFFTGYEKDGVVVESALTRMKTGFSSLKTSVSKVGDAFKSGGSAILDNGKKLATWFAGTKIGTAVTAAFTAVQKGLNAAFAANPIGFIIIAVVALIAIFVLAYKKIGWFRDFVDAIARFFVKVFKKAWDGIKDAFDKVWDVIWPVIESVWLNVIKPIWEAMLTFFKKAWDGIKKAFDKVWDAVWPVIQSVWEGTIKPIFEKMLTIFALAWEGIKIAFNLVWDIIKVAINLYWNLYIKPVFWAMKTIFKLAWNGIKLAFEVVWEIIKTAIDVGWAIIKPIFEAMGVIFEIAWAAIKLVFDVVWFGITLAIGIGWLAIKLIWEAMSAVFALAWDGIKIAFNFVWNIIKGAIDFAWNKVIKPVFEAMLTIFSKAWDGIKIAFNLVWDIIKGAIDFAWNKVIKPVFDKMGSVFATVWGVIQTTFDTIWNSIKTAIGTIGGVIEGLKSIFERVFGAIKGFVTGIWDGMVGAFKSIINGILATIEKSINWVIKMANKAIKYIPFVDYIKEVTLPRLESGGLVVGSRGASLMGSPVALAVGGMVGGSRNGILANIAENGKSEAVLPLTNPKVMGALADAIMSRAGTAEGSGAVVINVHPSKGMDEAELAAMVSRQLAFQLRRGAA